MHAACKGCIRKVNICILPHLCVMHADELIFKIRSRSARVAVVGLGYVGLPTAAVFADAGFRVTGADVKREVVEAVNAGRSPISEPGLEELVRRCRERGTLRAVCSAREACEDADAVIVVVQTPLDERGEPELEPLRSALRGAGESLRRGALVVVESTLPPGGMREVVMPELEACTGMRAGEDFLLAYSPERAIPTRTLEEIRTNPRLVGGIDEASSEAAAELYSCITSGGVYREHVDVVEMVKLVENTFRDVNIALANEIAVFCEALGVDVGRVIELANRHPRVNIHTPGAGVGGHCLPKDPMFLIGRARKQGLRLEVIEAARRRNESMPLHVLRKVERVLEGRREPKVAVLGVAYKGNTDDTRHSPAEKVIKGLLRRGVRVCSHDPFAKQDFGGRFTNSMEEAVRGADVVVIMTDHDAYRRMSASELKRHLKRDAVIVDARRVLDRGEVERQGLRYLGLGW